MSGDVQGRGGRRVHAPVRRGRGVLALGVAVALALGGCDSGPEGPGVLPAVVESPTPLGAVVLEFTGEGVTGFEAQGSVQVFGAVDSSGRGKHRVILVSPTGATELRFGVTFADRRGPMPAVVAISATSPANTPALASGVKVRIER